MNRLSSKNIRLKLEKSRTMSTKNRQLVADEPVEFQKLPVEVGDFRRITDCFRGIYRIYPT